MNMNTFLGIYICEPPTSKFLKLQLFEEFGLPWPHGIEFVHLLLPKRMHHRAVFCIMGVLKMLLIMHTDFL